MLLIARISDNRPLTEAGNRLSRIDSTPATAIPTEIRGLVIESRNGHYVRDDAPRQPVLALDSEPGRIRAESHDDR